MLVVHLMMISSVVFEVIFFPFIHMYSSLFNSLNIESERENEKDFYSFEQYADDEVFQTL